jgi:pimeloyl-ACP methyl ester carboxylesterase
MNLIDRNAISDPEIRMSAPGEFAKLTAGRTHYLLTGPENGRLIVLVHGIAGPMTTFDPLVDYLAQNGFRTLHYDLYGRGYSDRPEVRYDLDLFAQQLYELLLALDIGSPFTILGWSLGGMIAASYVTQFPNSVQGIVYIAPAGIQVSLPLAGRLAILPLLGEIIMAIAGRRVVLHSIANGVIDVEKRNALMKLASVQMNYRGYLRAFLSTLRYCAYLDVSDRYEMSGKSIPVMLITGSEDPSIPPTVQEKLFQLIPQIEMREISGVGHFPHYERPVEVGSSISRFLV